MQSLERVYLRRQHQAFAVRLGLGPRLRDHLHLALQLRVLAARSGIVPIARMTAPNTESLRPSATYRVQLHREFDVLGAFVARDQLELETEYLAVDRRVVVGRGPRPGATDDQLMGAELLASLLVRHIPGMLREDMAVAGSCKSILSPPSSFNRSAISE